MAEILDGKLIAEKIRNKLKNEVEELKKEGIIPKLAVIMVGNDASSKIYVRNKSIACNQIGIEYEEFLLDDNTTMEELLELIEKLNKDDSIHGILLQSPIPKGLDINEAFKAIDSNKDVDGFNPCNVGKLCLGQDTFVSCTPYGIIKLLEEYGIDIEGKDAVVVGRSNIVGKPMAMLLLKENGTVEICHSRTSNLKEETLTADILVAAVGKADFVTADMVKPGAVVIDVGMNRTAEGKLCGDVCYDEVSEKASYITPVPGGVGPMTITMLLENTVRAVENK